VPDLWQRAVGAVPVAALGLVAVWQARDFPAVPGQAYGPGLFPTVLGLILIGCTVGVMFQKPKVQRETIEVRNRIAALTYALTPALLFIGWEIVGWPLLSCVMGAVLLWVGGARWSRSLLGGVSIAALTWIIFALLLRVPLPRGPLLFVPY
jgi:putative tricarboxylic transport membrane protein